MTKIRAYAFCLLHVGLYFVCFACGHPPTKRCKFAVGKPPGYYLFQAGNIKAKNPPIAVFSTLDPNRCQDLCGSNESCWFIEFRRKESRCYLYDKKSTPVPGRYMSFWWMPCDLPSTCKQLEHRCKGFWLQSDNVFSSGARVIKTLTNLYDSEECRRQCLSSPLCAAINVRNIDSYQPLGGGYCELLHFSASNRTFTPDENSKHFEWRCCHHTDGDLPQVCRSQPGKCRGRWKSKPRQVPSIPGTINRVFTMSKFDCMSFCDRNPFCWSVFFNEQIATCLMKGVYRNVSRDCVNFDISGHARSNASCFVYEWTCCDPKQSPIQHHSSDSDPNPFDSRCVCLNASVVGPSILATDGCFEPLFQHNVTINSSLAAFWLMENREVKSNGRAWTRIFNGEINMWVARPMLQLKTCSKHHCNAYSTVIDANAECPPIVNRSQWFAQPPLHAPTLLRTKPYEVIVFNSVCPEYGCFSELTCGDSMRDFQRFHQKYMGFNDISYNFVVGEDGRIYEGRGAKVAPRHSTFGLARTSLSVSMIGWFENRVPNVASLRAMRLMLRCLEEQSLVAKEFRIMAHRDVRPSQAPGHLMYELMPNWHRYYKTLLPQGPNCDSVFAEERRKLFTMLFSGIAGGLLIVIAVLVYTSIWRHTWWCPARRYRTCKKSQPFSSHVLSSVGQRGAFERHVSAWPTYSTFRRPAMLQIHPSMTKLFVLMDPSCPECNCLTFISLLWARCERHALFEFPNLLTKALAIKQCKSYRILFWRDSLYLLHVRRRSTARKMLLDLQTNACLCRGGRFSVHPVCTPKLESEPEFKTDQNVLKVDCANNRRQSRIDLEEYCCMLKNNGGIQRDVTYSEFKHRQECGVEVESEDEGSDFSTSESEVEVF